WTWRAICTSQVPAASGFGLLTGITWEPSLCRSNPRTSHGETPIGRRCTLRQPRRCTRLKQMRRALCLTRKSELHCGGKTTMFASIQDLLRKRFTISLLLLVAVFAALLIFALHPLRAQTADVPKDDNSLLAAYRHVEVASVSDALEQVTGKKMYMSHRMRPIFPSKFAG